MPFALFFSAITFIFTGWSLGHAGTFYFRPLQDLCTETWSIEPLTTVGSAMICGRELPPGKIKELFLRAGLYHVLVVSGAHLVWLAELARRLFPRRPLWTAALLLLFAGMTGFGAPLVRAGLQMILQSTRRRPWLANIVWSYLATLVFHPGWWNSVSLHLSALAALALRLPLKRRHRGLAVIVMTLPIVLPFGSFTPLGALTGLLLSPVVELVLFPVCVIAWILPGLQSVANFIVHAGLAFLESAQAHFAPPFQVAPLVPRPALIFYFFALVTLIGAFAARGRLAR